MNKRKFNELCGNIYELHSQLCNVYNMITREEFPLEARINISRSNLAECLDISLKSFVQSRELSKQIELDAMEDGGE